LAIGIKGFLSSKGEDCSSNRHISRHAKVMQRQMTQFPNKSVAVQFQQLNHVNSDNGGSRLNIVQFTQVLNFALATNSR
jgi:hypothetical protein